MPSSDGNVEIRPLEIVTQAFPARPSALPDVRDFVRRRLTGATLPDDDVRALCDRVAEVLLDAAGRSGTLQVSLRVFPDSAEVDVLFAAEPIGSPRSLPPAAGEPVPSLERSVSAPPPSFAFWLAGRLRAEGLTMEAAARRLDVSAKTVSRWAAGTTEPRLRDLHRIREVFGEPFP